MDTPGWISRDINTLISQGDDVCALEKELSLEAAMKASGDNVGDIGDVAGDKVSGEERLVPAWHQTINGGGDGHDSERDKR